MIQVTVCMAAQAGCANLLVEALLPLMHRAMQCAAVSGAHVWADVEQAGVFWYHEDWRDSHALEARVRSEHFSQLLALMETSARPPVIGVPDHRVLRGLDYVAAVRAANAMDW